MIDPDNITNFDATQEELEEVLAFWICSAHNNGHQAAKVVNEMLTYARRVYKNRNLSPRLCIIRLNDHFDFPKLLQQFGLRCFNKKAEFLVDMAKSGLYLRTCTYEDLLRIKGVGPKTASCFLLHSRPGETRAGLDVHIKAHLKENGYDLNQSYENLQEVVLQLASQQGMTPAEFDLHVWKSRRIKPKSFSEV